MPDRLSIIALAVSAVALLVVLLTPTRNVTSNDQLAEIERIELRVDTEENATRDMNDVIQESIGKIDELRGKFDATREPDGPSPIAYAEKATTDEIKHRWKEFKERLAVLNAIRRKKPK